MINYNNILVSNLIFYGMIIFREQQETSNQHQELKEQLRICQEKLRAANLKHEKLNEELNLKSKQNKELEHDKRSLQEEISNLEKRPLLERPLPVAVQRTKLTDPAEGNSRTSTMVRDWDINLVQLSFK